MFDERAAGRLVPGLQGKDGGVFLLPLQGRRQGLAAADVKNRGR